MGSGAERTIALNVRDSRQHRNKSTPSGAEILAAGGKGKVLLKESYADVVADGLRTAFEAAGFQVAPEASIVVDADLRLTELEAKQFTDWKLDSETGSTLDAFRVVLPSKVRPTRAVTELTLVVRKHNRRLGLSHYVRKEATQESDARSVVENVLSESLTAAIEEATKKAAPDIAVAAAVPVSDTEFRHRLDAIAAQEEGLQRLQHDLEARRESLDQDRKSFLALQNEIERENNKERAAIQSERRRLARKRAEVEARGRKTRKHLSELNAALKRTEKEARRDATVASKLAELKAKQGQFQALERRLEDQGSKLKTETTALEARARDIADESQNLDKRIAEIKNREQQNRRLRERITKQGKELTLRMDALDRWEKDLGRRGEVEPPAPLVEAMPPLIVVTHPETLEIETSRERLTVRGLIVTNRPIRKTSFSVNGVELEPGRGLELRVEKASRNHGDSEVYKQQFVFDADLSLGSNALKISVWDDTGTQTVEVLKATYRQDPGQVHLVAIGINEYKHRRKVPSLRFAVPDAELVVETLRNGLKIPQKNVQLLTNDQATLRNIRLALGRRLWSSEGKEDTVVIYFSGHGAPEADSTSPDGIEKYLLPYDADPEDFSATALPMDAVSRLFQRLESERVVFLADTCYSGATGGRSCPTRGTSFRALILEGVDRRLEGAGRVILTASKGSEVAQELEGLGHGVFTYYLVEGLRQAADSNGDRSVTVNELYEYVSRMVPAKTGGAQHPQLHQDRLVGDIVIGVVNGRGD